MFNTGLFNGHRNKFSINRTNVTILEGKYGMFPDYLNYPSKKADHKLFIEPLTH